MFHSDLRSTKKLVIMKKLSLLLLVIMMTGSVFAQKPGVIRAKPCEYVHVLNTNYMDHVKVGTTSTSTVPFFKESSSTSDLTKVLLGSSRNIFGGLLSFQTCLTYNKELNTIMFTSRGNDKGSIVPFGTGNEIITYTSSDGGSTFVKKITFSNGSEPRYPSGVLYNPAGNTDTANTYKLVVGPLNVSSSWDLTYLNSGKYDGTGQNLVQIATDNTYKELMRNGLTATSDNKFHFSAIGTVLNSAQTAVMDSKLFTLTGTWNTTENKVDWNPKTEVETNVVQKPSDHSYYIDGSFTQEAWAKDGSIGYFVTLGADNRPASKPSFVPIVWKSTNAGSTWTQLPYFDWSTIPAIRDNIFPTKSDTTVYKPFFEEASVVLDANNKPHIFGLVRGGWSSNLDSLGFVFVRASTGTIMDGNVVELYQDESDAWHGNWVDSVTTDAVSDAESPYYSDPTNIGWDHRLSASVTDDGSKVFCTWTDTDWTFWGCTPYDFYPDLKGWGRDVFTNMNTPVRNFTENTELWGLAFFNFTSRNTMTNSPGTYDLPVTITDINTSGLQADEPVYHYYIKGCSFADNDFIVGTHELAAKDPVSVSPCYPNPFSGATNLDLVLDQSCQVVTTISSLAGVTISSVNHGILATGKHTLSVDGSGLKPGIYLLTVKTGERKFTNKMVVK
jgi:hypothetical protein